MAVNLQISLMLATECCSDLVEDTLAVLTILQHQHPICFGENGNIFRLATFIDSGKRGELRCLIHEKRIPVVCGKRNFAVNVIDAFQDFTFHSTTCDSTPPRVKESANLLICLHNRSIAIFKFYFFRDFKAAVQQLRKKNFIS